MGRKNRSNSKPKMMVINTDQIFKCTSPEILVSIHVYV